MRAFGALVLYVGVVAGLSGEIPVATAAERVLPPQSQPNEGVYPTPPITATAKYVRDFGAVGNGTTDDTQALQKAFNSIKNGGQLVFEPGRIYLIKKPLRLRDARDYSVIGRQATIKMANNSPVQSGYRILDLTNNDRVTYYDLTFDGNRQQRPGLKEQSGDQPSVQNVAILNSRDFRFIRVESRNAVMDGFIIGASPPQGAVLAQYARRGLFHDVRADNNWRIGLFIRNGLDITIENSSFTNSKGDWPMAGIDIEPNKSSAIPGVKNVLIRRSKFVGNTGHGIQLSSHAGPTDIIVEDNYFEDNARGAVLAASAKTIVRRNVFGKHTRELDLLTYGGKTHILTRGTLTAPISNYNDNLVIENNTFRNVDAGSSVIWVHKKSGNNIRIINNCFEDNKVSAIRSFKQNGLVTTGSRIDPPGGCPDPRNLPNGPAEPPNGCEAATIDSSGRRGTLAAAALGHEMLECRLVGCPRGRFVGLIPSRV